MPEQTEVCETLWIQSPGQLVQLKFDVNNVCESTNINAFTRGCLLGLILAAVLYPMVGMAGLAIILVCLVLLYGRWIFAKINPEQRVSIKEGKPGRSAETTEGFRSDGPLSEGFLAK